MLRNARDDLKLNPPLIQEDKKPPDRKVNPELNFISQIPSLKSTILLSKKLTHTKNYIKESDYENNNFIITVC